MNIRDGQPYVPLSHPFVERLLGTVGREYLDQVLIWSARDLEVKLMLFKEYYNKDRVHRGLDRVPPYEKIANTERNIAATESGTGLCLSTARTASRCAFLAIKSGN